MTGLIPLYAVAVGDPAAARPAATTSAPACATSCAPGPSWPPPSASTRTAAGGPRCWRWSALDRLPRLLERLGDEDGVPLARTACARSRPPTAAARSRSGRTATSPRRVDYEPAESTIGALRGQLQLARAGLVPGQRPADRGAAALPPAPGRRLHGRVSPRVGRAAHAARDRLRPVRAPDRRSSCPTRPGGGRCSATSSASRPTRRGATPCSSTSTSTATTAPASAPRTRPAGPAWWPT